MSDENSLYNYHFYGMRCTENSVKELLKHLVSSLQEWFPEDSKQTILTRKRFEFEEVVEDGQTLYQITARIAIGDTEKLDHKEWIWHSS